jgi:hypothetical protein
MEKFRGYIKDKFITLSYNKFLWILIEIYYLLLKFKRNNLLITIATNLLIDRNIKIKPIPQN